MFRVLTCPSSGGKIVFTQHLLSSLSVNIAHYTVRSQPVYCADVYRERRYQMLCEYNFSSWRWACQCSKHVEDNSVTNILLMNKENCALKLVDEITLYYDARSKKHQMADLWRDFWIRETGTGQQVAQQIYDDDHHHRHDHDDMYLLAVVTFWTLVTIRCFILLSGTM